MSKKITRLDGDLVQEALKGSVSADVLEVKRFHDDSVAVVVMRIKDKGITFGWKFTPDRKLPTYLKETELLPFFPEHVSKTAMKEIKREARRAKSETAMQRRLNKMPTEFHFGMFSVRGNKAVHKIVEKTPLGKDAEETYQSILRQMEEKESDYMSECMDTDVRSHVWSRVMERHASNED